jgi:hypothetical protein
MIKVQDGQEVAIASRGEGGWIVKVHDAFEKQRRFYPDKGGSFLLEADGTLGRQLRGTNDEKAPKSAKAMRSFLRKNVLGTM